MAKKIYLLVACTDEGIVKMWQFKARNERDVAAYICRYAWPYFEIFDRLGLVSYYDRSWETMEPEVFLEFVRRSRIDGDSTWGFEFYEIDPDAVEDVPESPVEAIGSN